MSKSARYTHGQPIVLALATQNHHALLRTALSGLAAVFLLVAAHPSARAADGDLDPTFGIGGQISTDISGAEDSLRRIAVQSDGKIVAVGTADFNTGGSEKIELARYNPDGTLDSTFGVGGKVVTGITGSVYTTANSLVIQPDGKIITAGGATLPNTVDSSFALARYNSDGTLDSTFGNGGIVLTNIGDNRDSASAVALQADGKIIAGGAKGIFRPPGEERNSDLVLVRYQTDGSLDSSFGSGGIVVTDFDFGLENFAEDVSSVLIQPDGKIVVAGDADGFNYYDFLVARYNSNGTLDATFGNNGFTKTDFGHQDRDGVGQGILQPDGKILLVGAASNANFVYDFALARYNSNGTLDASFGNGGKVTTSLRNLADEVLTAVALQSDGKILALGDSNASQDKGLLLFRFNADGSSDTGFGASGVVRTPFGSDFVSSAALAFQPDGQLLGAGFSPYYSTSDFVLARYQFGSLQMTGAVSRKTHGSAGAFDLNLPLTGTPGVECRDSSGAHTLVFTFNRNVVDGDATMVSGTATVGNPTYSGNTLTVPLTGVADAQSIMLTLSNVHDAPGTTLPARNVSVSFRVGDSNGNNAVTASDIAQTKGSVGAALSQANFRSDFNHSGTITASDVALVKAAASSAPLRAGQK